MHPFQVASVFSSNMVLQGEKIIRVFGWAPEGAKVVCTLQCEDKVICENAAFANDERFEVELPPQPKSNQSYTLTVTCGEEAKVMTNIAIGEVWLCGGQSNMEMELQNIKDGREMLAKDNTKNVRFYYTQKRATIDEEFLRDEAMMVWKEFSPSDAACWSGVGYLFGKQLADTLDCVVGLIGCNWGGTSASAWMDREHIEQVRDINVYLSEYEEKIAGKSLEVQKQEYDAYVKQNDEWQAACAKMYSENPTIEWDEVQQVLGPCQWPGPINEYNPFRPCGLYETMLERIAPFSMRGAIFYQGESDDHHPDLYDKLFGAMIENWRTLFREPRLPMMFVQLPMHRYKNDPDYKHWPKVREAQNHVFQTVKHTGMAVAIDAGEFNEIHPKDKRPVADRLCRQALCEVYETLSAKEANGPLFREAYFEGATATLYFDYSEGGFRLSEGETPVGFEIAGEDKAFVSANAAFSGETIVVSAEQVAEPKYVRYLWTNYGPVNVYGANGLPLAPFRTSADDCVEETATNVAIQQIMEL